MTISAGCQGQQDIEYVGRLLDASHFHTTNLAAQYEWAQEDRRSRSLEERVYINDVQHGMDNAGKSTSEPEPDQMPPYSLEVTLDSRINATAGGLAAELAPAP